MHFSSLNGETFHSMNSELRELPAVELSTLPIILKTVTESGIADQMRLTELILNDQDFFQKLMELFRICKDLENMDDLHMIFKIVKGIILLNSSQIFEKMFGDELLMDIIGSLEYDPDVPRVHHRNFLTDHVIFKEAVSIKNSMVRSKIHQTYRVGYLKDVVLARVLDEATVASLNSIIHSNNAIQKNPSTSSLCLGAYSCAVGVSCSSEFTTSENLLTVYTSDFILFSRGHQVPSLELEQSHHSLSKSLQMVQQLQLFRDLIKEGIFEIITDALQTQDKKLVLTGTDILILFLNQDPDLLHSYVVLPEGIPLLGLLVKGMITDFGDDMHCQFLEILRSLLDSFALSGAQRDTIIDIFYEKHLGQLIDVLILSCPDEVGQSTSNLASSTKRVESQNSTKPEILLNICELLCFCVVHHPYRIKCNFLLDNVIDKVLLLTRRREKYLVVAAVRFVRTVLSRRDEHLINHFVKKNLLKPVVDAFVANGNRYNVLNSAVLELFEYILKENLKLLVKYLVDSFWDQFVKFENLASIHSLKVKYEQCLENCGTKANVNVLDSRKRIDERAPEKEEEEYFNEDSDEEDATSESRTRKVQPQPVSSDGGAASYPSLSPRSGGLVDYDDDEDDEDYRPPPKKHSETSEDDGALESLRLKRKLISREHENEKAYKKQRLGKSSKTRDSVFAALFSTLSHAVLPSKKTANAVPLSSRSADERKGLGEDNHTEKESISPRSSDRTISEEDNHREKEPPRNCSDCVHSPSDSRQQLSGEDCPLIPQKSSPEMAVNGS
ncbi:putative protein translocase [Hibiscus syriacus]|uniref:Serine/threonine-protein phosphatase 4 regulatory subunit 3-like central domain-containing protein n=1 Tax=Hibiscus syriacus TaxID=106335 RepID=A0A6A2Z2X5_HIBSY|nr:putative protein translocase [Hibiscus syriacus]